MYYLHIKCTCTFGSCQFVVTANGDYSLHLTDPDILVDWKLVEQIVSCRSILSISHKRSFYV